MFVMSVTDKFRDRSPGALPANPEGVMSCDGHDAERSFSLEVIGK